MAKTVLKKGEERIGLQKMSNREIYLQIGMAITMHRFVQIYVNDTECIVAKRKLILGTKFIPTKDLPIKKFVEVVGRYTVNNETIVDKPEGVIVVRDGDRFYNLLLDQVSKKRGIIVRH